jgi:hypothetical protein
MLLLLRDFLRTCTHDQITEDCENEHVEGQRYSGDMKSFRIVLGCPIERFVTQTLTLVRRKAKLLGTAAYSADQRSKALSNSGSKDLARMKDC